MEQMRSEFEAWISNLSRGCADLHVNIYGDYDDPQVIPYWEAWQASRAAVELDLPPRKSAYASGYGDGYLVEHQDGEAIDYEDTVEILRAAGLRVKEK